MYGWKFTILMSNSTMAGTKLPSSVLYAAIPVCGLLMVIYGVELFFKRACTKSLTMLMRSDRYGYGSIARKLYTTLTIEGSNCSFSCNFILLNRNVFGCRFIRTGPTYGWGVNSFSLLAIPFSY